MASLMPSRGSEGLRPRGFSTDEAPRLRAQVGPSLLACDLAHLAEEAERMRLAGADFLHVDVMDGHFVPNLSWGPCVVAALRKHTDLALDCHLMVTHPDRWIEPMADAGVDGFTFHFEVTKKPLELIAAIRNASRPMRVGVALMPRTPPEVLEPVAHLIDLVLVMTVEAGFGGQPFLAPMLPKIAQIRERYPDLDIQVDGGLNPRTVRDAAGAGANQIVAGSAIFGADDPGAVIESLRSAVQSHTGRPSSPGPPLAEPPRYRRTASFDNDEEIRKMIYDEYSEVLHKSRSLSPPLSLHKTANNESATPTPEAPAPAHHHPPLAPAVLSDV